MPSRPPTGSTCGRALAGLWKPASPLTGSAYECRHRSRRRAPALRRTAGGLPTGSRAADGLRAGDGLSVRRQRTPWFTSCSRRATRGGRSPGTYAGYARPCCATRAPRTGRTPSARTAPGPAGQTPTGQTPTGLAWTGGSLRGARVTVLGQVGGRCSWSDVADWFCVGHCEVRARLCGSDALEGGRAVGGPLSRKSRGRGGAHEAGVEAGCPMGHVAVGFHLRSAGVGAPRCL